MDNKRILDSAFSPDLPNDFRHHPVSAEMWLTDDGGQVYMTVDTSQSLVFPEVAQFVIDNTAADSRQPCSAFDTKLEALANAASAQVPMMNQQIIVNGSVFPPSNAEPLPLPTLLSSSSSSEGDDFREVFLVSSGQLFCGECSATFESGDGFFQHWLENHCRLEATPAGDGEGMNLEQCERCNHVFVRGTEKFAEHQLACVMGGSSAGLRVGSGVKRKAEGGSFKTVKIARRPASSNHVSCGVCSVDLKTITSFFLHWLDHHHQIADILQEVWQCGQCSPSKLFPTRDRLRDHIRGGHALQGSVVHQCEPCGGDASYATSEELERHLRLHGPGVCAVCAGASPNVAQHFRGAHEVRCELCDCQVPADDISEHLAASHGFEIVWNRSDKLQQQQQIGDSPPEQELAKNVIVAPPAATAPAPLQPTALQQVVAPAAGKNSSSGSRCKACGMHFKSEKLLEKHYFANHEFQCKFCDLKMDKDLYGDHLRIHLASQRKKV